MTAADLSLRVNPRVVASVPGSDGEAEMALAGVHAEGVRIMAARAEFLCLRLDAIPFAQARFIKDSTLAVGADTALEEAVWAGRDADTPAVIMGTRRHYKALLKHLEAQGGEFAALAELMARCLNDYCRKDFCLSLPSGPIPLAEGRPLVMGVLNVTPDSFSDGGEFFEKQTAVDHALLMVEEGAGMIDIGGESTRPGSLAVPAEEEISRVVPVIEAVAAETPVPISIDTSKPAVAAAALDAGAVIINDVTALADEEMAALAAERGCPVVLMHMKGTPRTMQKSPFYRDLMGEITLFLRQRIEAAVAAGVDREQIVADPGIGFGKTCEHNLEILRRLKVLASLGRPILVGTSRKSFLGRILDVPPPERVLGTAVSNALALEHGAHILRAHDVAETREAVAVAACIARGAPPEDDQ
ncbi:MAG: dihydropteroate synthase [Planctomycetota bacterium]|jgi:dihydropteroate synthase